MFNPQTAQYVEYYLKPLQTAASKIDVKTFAAPVRGNPEIEAVVAGLGRDPGSGLIAMTDSFMGVHRKTETRLRFHGVRKEMRVVIVALDHLMGV
ncbi:MAG: hypothetical protein WA728_17275 [Xanthobacteraceae bacterium]